MKIVLALIVALGSSLLGLGLVATFTTASRALPLLPGPAAGLAFIGLGVTALLVGLVGFLTMRRAIQSAQVAESSPAIPTALRPVEWFSLIVSVALFIYAMLGLIAKLASPLQSDRPAYLFVLVCVAGLAGAWRSAKHLGLVGNIGK